MRKSLELNYELVLPIAGGARSYWIDYVMGDGATSIVYKAHYYDDGNNFHEVIIKECYPYSANVARQETSLVWDDPQEQANALEAFQNAHKKLSSIHLQNKLRNSTSATMEICSANNTLYSVQHLVAGITYDKDNTKKLEDILETTLALTKVIAEYHNLNMLHLDIKPENFMVLPETKQMAVLFDVDTVTSLNAIAAGSIKAIPSSEGWAAPEQLSGKLDQLCPATDLFAIGACLFSKVVGRKVTADDTGIFAQWDFHESITENANPQAIRLVRNILRKTIAASIRRRYQTAQELISALEDAVKVVREDVFVVSNCSPSLAQFIGREDELAKIHDHFHNGCRAVFLYGFGGMGKTELSKKYAECFGQEYDACVFHMYQPEDGLKKYMEQITIHNSDAKDHEKTLQAMLQKSKVLLIVDNFDVDDDEHLMDLLSLNADILFTTRNDHSDLVSDSIRILNLDALPMGQLLVLFQRELGRPMSLEDLQAARKIIESVDNWTMIVPIIAKQIVSSGKTVSEYAEMMENDGFRSLNEDTEEIRIRYHGKLYRKTPMEILRYVFDVGALDKKELEALCNTSVLRYHKALTKERYRYYTGAKNLNALNRIISAGWIKYDGTTEIISLHPMVVELIESDLERTPEMVPGLFKYISEQFEMLDTVSSIQEAKTVTFALLMLTDLELEEALENEIYLHLADFVARFFPVNISATYKLLFEAPEESTWSMNASYLPEKLAVPNVEKQASENMVDFLTDMLLKLIARYSFMLCGNEPPIRPIELTPSNIEGITNSSEAEAYIELETKFIDAYATICPSPHFTAAGELEKATDWRLSLKEYPTEYPYYRFLLDAVQGVIRISTEYEIDLAEKYRDLANDLIILIQDSLGLFEWHQLSVQQIIDYEILADDVYQKRLSAYKLAHYSKNATAWYHSLEKALSYVSDPYPIFKYVLNADFDLSKSRVALLLRNDFAAKLLFDSRLTGEQKRYLSVEFCAEQLDRLRNAHCRLPMRVKSLSKTHKSLLTLYAQLLSGAELLLEDMYTWKEEQTRIGIYRAAFILKRTIGVEILDPKPYIVSDINPHNIVYLAEFLELAEWTRTSGHTKQSKQMKNALLDCCLELEYDFLPEDVVQHILYRLEPLARNYKRQDVLDVLWKLASPRRSFCVDLIDSCFLSFSEKMSIISDLSGEILMEICDQYYERVTRNVIPTPSSEYVAYMPVFLEINQFIDRLCPEGEGVPPIWELCTQMCIKDNEALLNRSWRFAENCQMALRYFIFNRDLGISTDEVSIEGLAYLLASEADSNVLTTVMTSFMAGIEKASWPTKQLRSKIVENIHRIRPETKEFLAIE